MTSVTTASRRPATLAALSVGVVVVAVAAAVVGAAPSQAGTLGLLTVSPGAGNVNTTLTVTTGGSCPAAATNIIVRMTGNGFPAGGQIVVSNSALGAYSTTPDGGYILPLADTLDGFAKLQTPVATLTGRYDFAATCRLNAGVATYGDFTGSLWFTGTNAWQNTDPAPPTTAPPTTAPPTTAPPTTAPPTTAPPTTAPPTTAPPTTAPPTTAPPTTAPPTTAPPTTAPPTTAPPTTPAVPTATDVGGAPLPANPTLYPGDRVTVHADGFAAGETVGVTLNSASQALAPVSADGAGAVAYPFTLPLDIEGGSHSVVFRGVEAGAVWVFTAGKLSTSPTPTPTPSTTTSATTSSTVGPSGSTSTTDATSTGGTSAGELPRTGSEAPRLVPLALLLIAVGGAAVLWPPTPRGRHRFQRSH